MIFIFGFAETALTAVSGYVLSAAREFVDGQSAAVGTATAFCHTGFKLQGADFVKGKHGGFVAFFIAVSCNEGSTESTHDTGNIRTDGITAGNLFKAS